MPTSPFERFANWPRSGLYQQDSEKDACGLALVATLRGTPGHDIIQTALDALRNLEHRGAIGLSVARTHEISSFDRRKT